MLCDNYYFHCYHKWELQNCDSFHGDECPMCGKEICPVSSTEYLKENHTITHYHKKD